MAMTARDLVGALIGGAVLGAVVTSVLNPAPAVAYQQPVYAQPVLRAAGVSAGAGLRRPAAGLLLRPVPARVCGMRSAAAAIRVCGPSGGSSQRAMTARRRQKGRRHTATAFLILSYAWRWVAPPLSACDAATPRNAYRASAQAWVAPPCGNSGTSPRLPRRPAASR